MGDQMDYVESVFEVLIIDVGSEYGHRAKCRWMVAGFDDGFLMG